MPNLSERRTNLSGHNPAFPQATPHVARPLKKKN